MQPFINFLPKKQRIYDYFYEFASEALHIVIFENFVKSTTSCLSKLQVIHSFYFAFKITDDPTASIMYGNYDCLLLKFPCTLIYFWPFPPSVVHLLGTIDYSGH